MASRLLARLPRGYRDDQHFGLVYDGSPPQADDLTLIKGLSTQEAVLLNRLGVYFVAQIALWRHSEVIVFANELQLSPLKIIEDRWIDQAAVYCGELTLQRRRTSHLPASFLRTITLLTCALLFGFFCVYLLGNHRSQLLRGVLAAEITSLKVPATSRLISAHVKPGDEVFSGSALMTLEKSSHLTTIEQQQRRVQQMQEELRQAEARSELEISWRVREIERELFEARLQISTLQHVQQKATDAPQTAGSTEASTGLRLATVSVSQTADRVLPRAGGMVFFSGPTGKFSQIPLEIGMPPLPLPTQSAPSIIAHTLPASVMEPVATAIVSLQTQNLEARLERLESLREALPEQVRQAAGIEHLRQRFTEASRLLDEMQLVSRDLSITSPAYGVIGQVRFREGDQLTEGEILLKIVHTDRRYVTVYVPTRRVNELQPGNPVDLIFPGQQRYRGQVTDLPMLADSALPGGETLAAVRIEPTGRLWPQVPIGSQIDVVIAR